MSVRPCSINRRRDRRGIVGFLEFAGTLPVFAMLFLSAMALHLYYKQTRQAYAESQVAVFIRIDEDLSDRKGSALVINYGENGGKDGRVLRPDELAAGIAPAVRHLNVNYFQAVSARKTGTLSWLGPGQAVGLSYGNRDSWAHYDLEQQVKRFTPGGIDYRNNVESMPYVLLAPAAASDLTKQFLRI